MKCQDPKIGKLIMRYELNLVSDEEKRLFEAHLLDCDACYLELYSLSPAIKTMAANKEALLAVLETGEEEKVADIESDQRARRFFSIDLSHWSRRPRIGWQLGLAALAMILVAILLTPLQQTPAELATIGEAPLPLHVKQLLGRRATPGEQDMMQQGLVAYDNSDYVEAVRWLSKAHRAEPDNYLASFYLGASYLMLAQPDSAAASLQHAVGTPWQEQAVRARWLLANTYLLQDEVSRAKEQLRLVQAAGGEYANEATELLARLQEREDRFFALKWAETAKRNILGLFKDD